MPEDDTDTLRSQVSLAIVYGYLRRPEDAIPLVVDALEKGEKIGIPEYDMRTWRSELVRSTRAIQPSPTLTLPLDLAPWHDD